MKLPLKNPYQGPLMVIEQLFFNTVHPRVDRIAGWALSEIVTFNLVTMLNKNLWPLNVKTRSSDIHALRGSWAWGVRMTLGSLSLCTVANIVGSAFLISLYHISVPLQFSSYGKCLVLMAIFH